jgi:hypothetical protein
MSLPGLLNIIRREAEKVLTQVARPRMGTVTSYDPASYCAKVLLQPEGVETGFLPIATDWLGNGWGLFCPPTAGDVVEVQFQEGGKNAGYIKGRLFGDQFRPLAAPSGEFWLVHKTGSFIKLLNDGTIRSKGDWYLDGTLYVAGDVVDQTGTNSDSMRQMRTLYNEHVHSDPQGGATGVPNPQM